MDPAQPFTVPAAPHGGSKLRLLIIGLAVLCLLLGAGFIWALTGYLDYKSNTDKKIAAGVAEAEKKKAAELEAGFQIERNRLFNTYTTDPVIANVTLEYPRDWSFYLEQDTKGRPQIDAKFHPRVVMAGSPSTVGLRLRIEPTLYDDVVADYQRAIEQGELTASPLQASGVNGLRLDGQIDRDHRGAVVIFPIRDKTLVISTESTDFISVFNEAISKLSFTP